LLSPFQRRRTTARACCSANAAAVRAALREAGLSEAQLAQAFERAPALLEELDVDKELSPRLTYLHYLRDTAPTRWCWPGREESVAEFVARQPGVLERRFQLLHADADWVAISKPWDTRHDVPRGWGEREGRPPRFSPKWRGDELSAEEWCAALPGVRWEGGLPRFAHQLDFATSGVLLASTTRVAAGRAAAAFRDRTAHKTYTCLLMGGGVRPGECWSVSAAVGPDERDGSGFKMRIHSEAELAAAQAQPASRHAPRAAQTRFKALARGVCRLEGPFLGRPLTLAQAEPVTGRRHQIRLHAAASGHPILGDAAYSDDNDSFRMFLHATSLHIALPAARAPAPGRRRGEAAGEAAAGEATTLRLEAAVPRSFALAFQAEIEVIGG